MINGKHFLSLVFSVFDLCERLVDEEIIVTNNLHFRNTGKILSFLINKLGFSA